MSRVQKAVAGFFSRRINRRRRISVLFPAVDSLEVRVTPTTAILSGGLTGVTAAGESLSPSISADNRYVAFASTADNLVAGDRNALQDVFLRDLQTGSTVRISRSISGGDADGISRNPHISADGNWVVFESFAANLVANDENSGTEIFLFHRSTASLTRVLPAGFASHEYQGSNPDISGDGRYVVFESGASTLVAGDTNGTDDIFRVDRQTGIVERVSLDSAENQGSSFSQRPTISNNGRYVAFQSYSELVATDAGSHSDVFVRDMQNGTTVLASVSSSEVPGDSQSFNASISADGMAVVFLSQAGNLASEAVVGGNHTYLRNLEAGTTTLVSKVMAGADQIGGSDGSHFPSISDDKRFVVFQSYASNIVVGTAEGFWHVYRRDMQTLTTTVLTPISNVYGVLDTTGAQTSPDGTRVIVASTKSDVVANDHNARSDVFVYTVTSNVYQAVSTHGTSLASIAGNDNSHVLAITPDARFVLFSSDAKNLGVVPSTPVRHLYRKDRQTGAITLVSVNNAGESADAATETGAMSSDGRYIVFDNSSTNLANDDTNGNDVFLRDMVAKTTTRISVGSAGVQANGSSINPSISGDGRYVVFESTADNLVTGDTNAAGDIFLFDRTTGATSRVSVSASGTELPSQSLNGQISRDGSTISFVTYESLLPADTNGVYDVYVRSRTSASTLSGINISTTDEWVSAETYLSSMSDNGRFVVFDSRANSLTPHGSNQTWNTFMRDRQLGTTVLVSVNPDNNVADGDSNVGGISSNGRFVAFRSLADDLVANDTNNARDVFVRDLQTSQTYRISNSAGGLNSNGESTLPLISSDGLSILFDSQASNLVTGVFGGYFNVYSTMLQLAPTDITLSNTTTHEQTPLNTVIGSFEAVDLNTPESFSYALVPGTGSSGNSAFTIVDDELRLNSTLNFETKPSYSIRVQVTDSAGLKFVKNFTITITNRNEPPTGIALSVNSINENLAALTTIGTLTTTDPDAGPPHVYSLVAGAGDTDNAAFSILGNKIRARASLNFESKSSYKFRIRTLDSGNLNFETSFTIFVGDVNEAPTGISMNGGSTQENAALPALIGTLTTNDPDVADSYTYSLVAGAGSIDNVKFEISGNQLRAKSALDFEAKKLLSVRVRATDSGGLSVEDTFTVNVTNVNESPTDITLDSDTVQENKPSGTAIGNLSGIDPDAGSAFSFALVAGTGSHHNSLFRLVGSQLQLAVSFDFEAIPVFSIRVRTRDNGGLAFEKALRIVGLNANEAPTKLSLDGKSIEENKPSGAEVGRFTATDPDAGGTFVYYLVPGIGSADNLKFYTNGNRLLARTTFNYEVKRIYSVRARTVDNGGLMIEQVFTISIDDVNETPASISLSSNKIAEGVSSGRLIGKLTGTDPDENTTLSWFLPAGVFDNSNFRIVGNELRTVASLDFETDPSHTILIKARDNGGLSLLKAYTIDVNDVSESVLFGMDNVTVPENAAIDTVAATFSLAYKYSFVPGIADNAAFRIAGNKLLVATNLNHEAKSLRTLRINVSPRTGVYIPVYFIVAVSNVNEHPAIKFANRPISTYTIYRNTTWYAQGGLTISDPDPGADKGELTATLTTSKGTIKVRDWTDVDLIGNGTGEVTIRGDQAAVNASLKELTVSPNGYVGPVDVAVEVADRGNSGPGGALTATKTFRIVVQNRAPAPPISSAGLVYTLNAGVNTFTVSEAVGLVRGYRDIDGDALSVKRESDPIPQAGTIKINSDGSFSFTRNNGFRGTVYFTIRYSDGLADSILTTVTLRLL